MNRRIDSPLPVPALSILIPTLNEIDNIDLIVPEVLAATTEAGIDVEILIVDGGSTDGTQSRVEAWTQKNPAVRLVQSDANQGLSGDIMYGVQSARAEAVMVMDADLSHPPSSVPALVAPVLAGTHDFALGSRYILGGDTPGWPWWRQLTSRTATLLAWPIVSVSDPMSGFFAMRREDLLELGGDASGFKIAMEVLARGGDDLRVIEVPITFSDRIHGESKLGMKEITSYLKQLCALGGNAIPQGKGARAGVVVAASLALDIALFFLFTAMFFSGFRGGTSGGVAGSGGLDFVKAHFLSFILAMGLGYWLNAKWVFPKGILSTTNDRVWRFLRLLSIGLLALLLRSAILAALIQGLGLPLKISIVIAMIASALVNLIGSAFFVFSALVTRTTPALFWRITTLCMVSYVLLLRLSYGVGINLIPEEAYYWMYAQHLDIGYLDHPPMVAWLIALSTSIFGNHELAIRLPAMGCWLVAAFFMFQLARHLFDKTTAFRTVLLLAVFPMYFSTGLVMTPDAPLYACWAGCLYFLERALYGGKAKAWIGLGIFTGLGMLSKYSLGVLGPAVLVFLLLDRQSRRWFLRPGPYVAVLVALIIFLPVLIWNYQHDWMSFTFQGTRRWAGSSKFSLHLLIGAAFLLVTPMGLIGIFMCLTRLGCVGNPDGDARLGPRHRFALIFTLIPLIPFLINSLQHAPKLNWTGPVWLASLPLLAWSLAPLRLEIVTRARRLWMATLVTTVLVLGFGLSYVTLGLPGLPPFKHMIFPVAWEEVAHEVKLVEQDIESRTGHRPVVIGMDRYWLSSEISFYNWEPDPSAASNIMARHLLDRNSLMWMLWQDPSGVIGKNVLLLSFYPDDFKSKTLPPYFARLGPIFTIPILKNGYTVCHLYWCLGYDYTGPKAEFIPQAGL